MESYTIGKVKFDDLLRISLTKEVFMKLPLIYKYVYTDNNFEMLLRSLKSIHGQPAERILDLISMTNNALVKQFGKRITQETAVVYYSSVLWEWFYLLAYYIHQFDNDPQWHENYLPHIHSFQIRQIALEEIKKGVALIDLFVAKRKRVLETQKQIQQAGSSKENESNDSKIREEYLIQITQLKTQLNIVQEENAALKKRIAELEKNNKSIHLSFIETNAKSPDSIKWAYADIEKAIVGPAEMAECIHDLQVQGMLKNQDRCGKLKRIKKIHDELQQTYGFDWTYDALRRALNRITAKK